MAAFKQFDWVTQGSNFVEIACPKAGWSRWPHTECDADKDTLYTKFRASAIANAANDFLGAREVLPNGRFGEYRFISYGEGFQQVTDMGSALVALGMTSGEMGAIFAPNCPQWTLCEFAMFRQGIVTVPLYATFGIPALGFILEQTELKVGFIAPALLGNLLQAIQTQTEEKRLLKTVVLMSGDCKGDELRHAADLGLRVVTWDQAIQMGKDKPAPETPSTPDELHTVMYTSGTTGNPKGVLVTHRGALSNTTKAMSHQIVGGHTPIQSSRHYSYLPLAHCAERSMIGSFIRTGGTIGYSCGNLALLLDDMEKMRPTMLVGVPRVWKRIYDKVEQGIDSSGFVKRMLFRQALATKAAVEQGSWSLIDWDKIIFNKVAQKIGGQCKYILSGAAPLKEELWLWMQRVFCLEVGQSYGLTETYGAMTCNPAQKVWPTTIGSCGIMLPESWIRLVDVPDLGYLSTNPSPSGEIWCKGPSVTKGYFKEPALTAEAVVEGGWFRTGDIGRLNPDGSISIIDRIKNLFKLAQGEYVPAEYIETLLQTSKLVAQVWVHGESTETFVIALAVPNVDTLAAALNVPMPKGEEAVRQFCASSEARAAVMADFTKISKEANLPGFQLVKAVGLSHEPWGIENGLATPTFKLKRPFMRERFKATLQELFDEVKAKQI